MAFTHTTSLGRRVLVDDWQSFHRDSLLGVLYEMREIGGDGNGLTMEAIASVTGLERGRVAELVQMMSSSRLMLIRMDVPPNVWLITARGVRWVEESPSPQPPFGV